MGDARRVIVGIGSAAAGFGVIIALWFVTAPAEPATPPKPRPERKQPPVVEAAKPAPPARTPEPSKVDRRDLDEAERHARVGEWDRAAECFRRAAEAGHAEASALEQTCLALRDAAALVERDDTAGAGLEINKAYIALQRVVDETAVGAWSERVALARSRVDDASAKKQALDTLAAQWPLAPLLPDDVVLAQAGSLLGDADPRSTKRAIEFVGQKMSALLDYAENMLSLGRVDDAEPIFRFALERFARTEWAERAQAGATRCREALAGTPADSTAKPATTGESIELPFAASDIELSEDGRHLLALNPLAGELVVYGFPAAAEVARVGVLARPLSIAVAGGHVWTGSREGSEMEMIDPATWSVKRRVPLLSPGPILLAASPLASPPRVWATSSQHVHVFDATSGEMLFNSKLGRGFWNQPPQIHAHPYGEVILLTSGASQTYVWQPGRSMNATPVAYRGSPVFDGRGQYALSSDGLYESTLTKKVADGSFPLVAAGHPDLPYMVTYDAKTGQLDAVDLYRRGAVKGHNYRGRVAVTGSDMYGHPLMRLRLRRDAPGVILAPLDPNASSGAKTTIVHVLPLPIRDVDAYPGYFAFTSAPSRAVAPGLPWSYTVRVAAPFDARAAFTPLRLPKGIRWDAATRTFSWKPTLEDIGVVEFAVRAEDPQTKQEVQQEISLIVDLRVVGVTGFTADGRYLIGANSEPPFVLVYDLDEDRELVVPTDGPAAELAVTGGRVYYLRSDIARLHSFALPAGDDPKEHEFEGMIPRAISGDNRGNLYVLAEENAKSFRLLRMRDGKRPVSTMAQDRAFGFYVSDDGTKALIAAGPGGTYDLYKPSDDKWVVLKEFGLTIYGSGGVYFSADGNYLMIGQSIYDSRSFEKLVDVKGSWGFDPSGPYYAVAEQDGIGLYKIGRKDRFKVVDYPKLANGTELKGRPFPFSKRDLILVAVGGRFYVYPRRF